MMYRFRYFLLLALAAPLVGCGSQGPHNIISGIVMLDGKPLASADLAFFPKDSNPELGTATMSLYRHVRGKDELLMAMADNVFARYPLPAAQHRAHRTVRDELYLHLQCRG